MKNPDFYNLDAEASVMGGLIIDNEKYSEISKIIDSNDFYNEKNEIIFNAIKELHNSGLAFDLITLSDYLKNHEIFNAQMNGAFPYLTDLANNIPSMANLSAYAKIIKENANKRASIKILDEAKQKIFNKIEPKKVMTDLNNTCQKLLFFNQENDNSQLIAINIDNFLKTAFLPRKLLLNPWLPESGLALIHASRGVGKTHVSLNIAYAVASGGEFLGWRTDKSVGVLFIDGEMPASVLQSRLHEINQAHGNKILDKKLLIITPDSQKYGMPDLATLDGQTEINKHINDDIGLIIIDNLSCLVRTGRENESESWQPIQAWALNLRSKGKTVLFIHHQGKGGGQRGSSKKEDVLDSVISLNHPKDYESSQGARFVVSYEKARGFCGEESKPFEAQLKKDSDNNFIWITRGVEDSTYDKVVSMINDGLSQTDISIELEINKSTVSRHVARAKKEGLIK